MNLEMIEEFSKNKAGWGVELALRTSFYEPVCQRWQAKRRRQLLCWGLGARSGAGTRHEEQRAVGQFAEASSRITISVASTGPASFPSKHGASTAFVSSRVVTHVTVALTTASLHPRAGILSSCLSSSR